MKKYLLMAILSAIPLQAFCHQMTYTSNAWQVQNDLASLQSRGCRIYDVHCQNPYADREDQRWIIVFDQKQ